MSNPDIQEPMPWAPGEDGKLIVELNGDREPLALHAFASRRAAGTSDIWFIFDVCELRGIDHGSIVPGYIEKDGIFSLLRGRSDDARKAVVAFIEATDSRLRFDGDPPIDEINWTFE